MERREEGIDACADLGGRGFVECAEGGTGGDTGGVEGVQGFGGVEERGGANA